MTASARFVPDINGIRSLMKGGEMRSVLESHVGPSAAAANAAFQPGRVKGIKGSFVDEPRVEPYAAYVDDGKFTAIGKVVARTEPGRADNAEHNTLLKTLR